LIALLPFILFSTQEVFASHPESGNACFFNCHARASSNQDVTGISATITVPELEVRIDHCDYDKAVVTQWVR